MRYVGQLLFEGGSTAQGFGDEAEKLGYAGRLAYYYRNYSAAARKDTTLPCRLVGAHFFGQPDRTIDVVLADLPRHATEARLSCVKMGLAIHLIGVFAVCFYPGGLGARLAHNNDQVKEYWVKKFSALELACNAEDVAPIFLSTPKPDKGVPYGGGRLPDLDLLEDLTELARARTQGWADFIRFEDIVNSQRDDCVAPDGIHPNARGYDKIAGFLKPIVDAHLGIKPT